MESLIKILENCLKSDRNSQKWVYESFYGYALKIAYRYTNSYQDASSIANDSFVKVFTKLTQFELVSDEEILLLRFKGWIRRIVINTAIDETRRKKNSLLNDSIDEDCWDIADQSEYSDSRLLYKELIGYVKELPENYQRVFNLYVIDGYSHPEIAELLSIPVGTSKSNLSRAKEALQKKLSEFFETKKS